MAVPVAPTTISRAFGMRGTPSCLSNVLTEAPADLLVKRCRRTLPYGPSRGTSPSLRVPGPPFRALIMGTLVEFYEAPLAVIDGGDSTSKIGLGRRSMGIAN